MSRLHSIRQIIITGEEGLAHGYDDRTRADGVLSILARVRWAIWSYSEATLQLHNMLLKAKVSFFRKTAEGLRFLDEMVYEKHHTENTPDREGQQRDAIVFELRPLSAIVGETAEQSL